MGASFAPSVKSSLTSPRLIRPSQSPDANTTENMLAYLKHTFRGRRVRTLKQLTRQIRLIWRSLPKGYEVNLVVSMPRRCQAIINADSDWTSY
ncbi:hypothetical protein Trydic_g7569 [Trypoxylus dichotomus]